MPFARAVHARLAEFTAISGLSLHGTHHPSLGHVMTLICAVPNVCRLSLGSITARSSADPEHMGDTPPTLTHLHLMQRVERDLTEDIVYWVSEGETWESLQTLSIGSAAYRDESFLFSQVPGASVRYLSCNIRAINNRCKLTSDPTI